MRGKPLAESTKRKLSEGRRGSDNPFWKGDAVGYSGVHTWARSNVLKPELCASCGLVPPVDIANISQEYKRDISDWEYLCRKCHMDKDGRSHLMAESGKSRRIPDKVCKYCGSVFHRDSGMRTAQYCSRKCMGDSGGRWAGKITLKHRIKPLLELGFTPVEISKILGPPKGSVYYAIRVLKMEDGHG